MKRYAKYLIGPAVIAVVAVLVMVNRNSVQEDIDRASAKQLPVVLDGVEQIYEYSEEDPAYVEFDAQMRKPTSMRSSSPTPRSWRKGMSIW